LSEGIKLRERREEGEKLPSQLSTWVAVWVTCLVTCQAGFNRYDNPSNLILGRIADWLQRLGFRSDLHMWLLKYAIWVASNASDWSLFSVRLMFCSSRWSVLKQYCSQVAGYQSTVVGLLWLLWYRSIKIISIFL
jgi:hypothetical protein